MNEEQNPINSPQSYPDESQEPTEQPIDELQEDEPQIQPTDPDNAPINWMAQEYLPMEKNALWYVLFAIVVLGFIALDIFVLKSYTFSALVIVMAIAVIVFARRPPRTIQYTLSGRQGLYVGEKLYTYGDFKAFGLIKDGEHNSIMLIPTKRFSPGVSVYFPEEAGEEIVDILGARLPMKPLKLDALDILVRQLRL